MKITRVVALLLIAAWASGAHARAFCGFAFNFANGTQAKVRWKAYKLVGETVTGRLVCSKWHSICNGKAGKIRASVRTDPATSFPSLSGALSYGTKLVCGVYCQVEGTVANPDELFCQFNCPTGSNAVQVSFTVGKTVCVAQ